MIIRRMRVFAGPNGSGKTTIIKELKGQIPFGEYVNADDIEKVLNESGKLLFSTYNLHIEEQFLKFFSKKANSPPFREMNLIFGKSYL